MLELLSLKDLCEALVNQQFESVHDAEQALEKFEHLTTPAAVLSLLNELDDARNGMRHKAAMRLKRELERLQAEVRNGGRSRDASVASHEQNMTRQEEGHGRS